MNPLFEFILKTFLGEYDHLIASKAMFGPGPIFPAYATLFESATVFSREERAVVLSELDKRVAPKEVESWIGRVYLLHFLELEQCVAVMGSDSLDQFRKAARLYWASKSDEDRFKAEEQAQEIFDRLGESEKWPNKRDALCWKFYKVSRSLNIQVSTAKYHEN